MAPSLGPPRDSTAQLPFRPLLRVQAQVQRLRQTLLDMQGVNYNNRAVQPLHGRSVLSAPASR